MAAAALCSSPGDCEDHDCWPRDGPVRLRQGSTSVRKNRPAACEECRRRRVRCSAFETGAPCEACCRHETICTIGAVKYAHDASSPTQIYAPVLPPPAPPASTPSLPPTSHLQLSLNVLNSALESSKPRPPPLVWESPNEHIQKGAPTTRSKQKAIEPKDEGEAADELESVAPPPKRLRPAAKSAAMHVAHDAHRPELKSEKAPRRTKHKHLARSEPVRPARHFPVSPAHVDNPPQLVIYSSRFKSNVSVSAWKEQSRQVDAGLDRPHSSRFPHSSIRDEPNLRAPYPSYPCASYPSFAPTYRSFTASSPAFRLDTVPASSATTSASTSSWTSDFGSLQHYHRRRNGESSTTSISETPQCD
ncbi:hypothetical protein NBRC10513_003155 [Rhodotorula toruloides]|uniref:BY PROTMAP: gi/472584990/gb/EMS22565.1/ transcription factor [Rhodosporidium toruloides NP11] gi/647400873/emb/CDR46709.1/ RHTO0S13e00474g1_1 [Rhodosporidium toruloides] n=1 Tax=Rhodotorula toruloides TaxID=5286 RepID=A0A0K3CAP1_RHOTO